MRDTRAALCAIAVASGAGTGAAAADPANAPAIIAIDPGEADAIAARLVGQRFAIADDRRSVRIDDVAGLGPPIVGVVERRGDQSWLVPAGGDPAAARRLVGPLARPRIAGPGYTVWIVGAVGADGSVTAQRLGVLRRPAR